ncbi:hypothetical protein JQ604_38270 [Bradyrhizobium jicamae]|uniref:DUF6065 family protein n=1 Tax=Bradyrhizobium jicamae TaxID=280332 RepID=UPI001BAE5145|nr:DUF6065 family protein [Bradyrhizobium jicamae]MBR0758060.1 hypothetical protein [Bradyrhizobium jicamae]
MSNTESDGMVTFFRMIPGCPPPQRADRSAGGMLPTRAFRYCDPVTTASAFGWYVFPPFGFALHFDGTNTKWTFGDQEAWYPLGAAQFPDFARYFDEHAPRDLTGCSPPFITAFPEPGYVQIWSGLIARTKPGWSLLIRPVPNFPRSLGFELFEGIVETDTWFGPLFTNLRIRKTDVPVEFQAGMPLFHIQPIQRHLYEGRLLDDFQVVGELDDWSEADWEDYRATVVAPNLVEHKSPGKHAVKLRRRRRSA